MKTSYLKKCILIFCSLSLLFTVAVAQNYTSYFTGNSTDEITNPQGGTCLMGGATEHDNAMRWFLQRADGGDVLVIRASGSDGYNNYMYSELGEVINSVETILFHNAAAAQEAYVLDRINKAEAIWIAGGNQWNYVSYWRNTPVAAAINDGIQNRNIAIGGTSAGMAILGGGYFTAENGTVYSEEALNNPYNIDMAISNEPFIDVPFLQQVITDTHYDDPDRKGRHTAFLARAFTDYSQPYYGIGAEEYTAVCIGTDGIANVYGDYPDYDEKVFFLVPNCEFESFRPEICMPGQPLTWDRSSSALKVYQVRGTPTGLYSFDLNTWATGDGGDWQEWSAVNGLFQTQDGTAIDCLPIVDTEEEWTVMEVEMFPNPITAGQGLQIKLSDWQGSSIIQLWSTDGRKIKNWQKTGQQIRLEMPMIPAGIYQLKIELDRKVVWQKVVIK